MSDCELAEHRARLLAVLEAKRKRSRRGCNCPPPAVGWEIVEAGYRTLRDLGAAVPVSFELLSRIRSGAEPLSDRLRRRLADLLDIDESWVLVALRRKAGPRWRW